MDVIAVTILALMLTILLSQVFKWAFEHLKLRKKLSSIPGPSSLPFIGMSLQVRKIPVDDILQYGMDLNFKYKNGMIIMWVGTEPIVHIRKPHQMEVILRSRTLIGKSGIYNYIAYWLGNGLFTSNGDVWHRNRRLITPAFHFNILDEFMNVIAEKVEVLNECLKIKVEKDPKKLINVYPMAISFTLDTVCKTFMGVDQDIQGESKENEYVRALHKFATLTVYRFIKLPLRWDAIFYRTKKGREYQESIKKLHAFSTKVIKEKIEMRKSHRSDEKIQTGDGKHKTKAFLDLVLDLSEADENPWSLEEVREQVDTFMFAGHDTTGIAMSYALFCIGNNPEVQKRVQKEINEVFSDKNEPITKAKLAELKYLERVIKESLRMFPSAPKINRTLDHDVEIDNHNLPKGTLLTLHILCLHRDPEVWKDPDTFDPDRFLPENSHGRHPYAFLPFSAGPRNCIGQKFAMVVLKIGLAGVLRKWTVRSELKMQELNLCSAIVLTPRNETLNLWFTPIEKSVKD